MVSVVISVGSNCGDRRVLIDQTINWLKSILSQTVCSEIYETPCAKKVGKPYLNVVVKGFYLGSGIDIKDQLVELFKGQERKLGRNSSCRENGDVPIDIDLVIMDGEILRPWDYRQKFFQIGYSQL